MCVKDSLSQDDEDLAEAVKGIDLNNVKLHLPVDGVMALANFEEEYSRIGAVGTLRREEGIFDIGPETIEKFRMILNEAKTIIWNGPLGFFERPEFSKGDFGDCQNNSTEQRQGFLGRRRRRNS